MTETTAPEARRVFAHRLKELRQPRGFKTARSFAAALGIDENRYTRYERAEVEPDLTLIMRICQILGITPNELMSGEPGSPMPGFAELAAPFPHDAPRTARSAGGPAAPTPSEVHPAEGLHRASIQSVRRTLAWQLATEVATLTQPRAGGEEAAQPLAAIQAISRLYHEADANPFAFVAKLSTDPRLAHLPPQQAQRLAGLMTQLAAATNREILGEDDGTAAR